MPLKSSPSTPLSTTTSTRAGSSSVTVASNATRSPSSTIAPSAGLVQEQLGGSSWVGTIATDALELCSRLSVTVNWRVCSASLRVTLRP